MRSIAGEREPSVQLELDGQPLLARNGDTVLMALLRHGEPVRHSEFTGKPRAGFCLMGACQDCWVTVNNTRVRACTTPAVQGMRINRDGSHA